MPREVGRLQERRNPSHHVPGNSPRRAHVTGRRPTRSHTGCRDSTDRRVHPPRRSVVSSTLSAGTLTAPAPTPAVPALAIVTHQLKTAAGQSRAASRKRRSRRETALALLDAGGALRAPSVVLDLGPMDSRPWVREQGVVLQSARGPLPNLAEYVASESIHGAGGATPQARKSSPFSMTSSIPVTLWRPGWSRAESR